MNRMSITEAIDKFEQELPGWWWSIGSCHVSSDASCAPDRGGPDDHLLKQRLFDEGFHADLPQPSTIVDALMEVLEQAKRARAA